MLYHLPSRRSSSLNSALEGYDYETLFSRSPNNTSLLPPIEPSPFSLDSDTHMISPGNDSFARNDAEAAILLTSIKKVAVKETLSLPSPDSSTRPTQASLMGNRGSKQVSSRSKVSRLGQSRKAKTPKDTETALSTTTISNRARAVSLDSQHFASCKYLDDSSYVSTFSTDALPMDRIALDLTSDRVDASSFLRSKGLSVPRNVSPPNSPVLLSRNNTSEKIETQVSTVKKRQRDANTAGSNVKCKKRKQKIRLSILHQGGSHQGNPGEKKQVLKKKFSWKNHPELEEFLIANREEYLRHSAMNYTMQQKEYNNRLTERLLELASDCGYIFDEESFSFVSIRDRIRCYFKSYVQSKKKRGLILGYAARRKGLISEKELEKSAGIKGTIVVPHKNAETIPK